MSSHRCHHSDVFCFFVVVFLKIKQETVTWTESVFTLGYLVGVSSDVRGTIRNLQMEALQDVRCLHLQHNKKIRVSACSNSPFYDHQDVCCKTILLQY